MNDDARDAQLRSVLEPRRALGWRFEDDMGWCLGLGGAARLVANVDKGRFHLFDHGQDSDDYFDDIDGFMAALPARERANRGLTKLQHSILDDHGVELSPELVADHQRQLAEQDRAFADLTD